MINPNSSLEFSKPEEARAWLIAFLREEKRQGCRRIESLTPSKEELLPRSKWGASNLEVEEPCFAKKNLIKITFNEVHTVA